MSDSHVNRARRGHSPHVAVLTSAACSGTATIEGFGRSCHGFEGNHSAADAACAPCREHDPLSPIDVEDVEIRRHFSPGSNRDSVEMSQFTALAVVGIDISAHLRQPARQQH